MNPSEFTTCAYCPRLCRHVCPVAVGTGREAATPSSLMTAPLLLARGDIAEPDARAATDLCLGCGACTTHCKVHIPVAERLSAWRADHGAVPAPAPLGPIDGEAKHVCVLTSGDDWSAAWSAATGNAASTVRTNDALGHASWRAGARDRPADLARHFAGRTIVTASGAAAAMAESAGIVVIRLSSPEAPVSFRTCHEPGGDRGGQLACCGWREGFAHRAPEAARELAEENVRRLDGARTACADEDCARWLRAHGASVVDPVTALIGEDRHG